MFDNSTQPYNILDDGSYILEDPTPAPDAPEPEPEPENPEIESTHRRKRRRNLEGVATPIKWGSIRQIKWTDQLYKEVVRFVETGEPPAHLATPAKVSKWKSKFKHFGVRTIMVDDEDDQGDDGKRGNNRKKELLQLVLQLRSSEDVFWAINKDGETLFEVNLPYFMTVIPQSKKHVTLTKLYPELTHNAFRSVETFFEKLTKQFVGITRDDVIQFMKTVELRQLQVAAPISVMEPIVTKRVNQQWEMDLVDVQSKARFNSDTNYLFTVIDCFSKYAWVRPVKSKHAAVIANELQNIILMFGAPEILSSDNGSEFINSDIKVLATRFNIHLRHSLPHHPRAQGQIERFNGTIKRNLNNYMGSYQSKAYLPGLQFVVYAYNTARHKTTKFAPMAVYFHRDVRTDQTDKLLIKTVAANIQKKADQMVLDDMKKNGELLLNLRVGDQVRISMLTLHDQRKKSQLISKKTSANWSKEKYYVSFIREPEIHPDDDTAANNNLGLGEDQSEAQQAARSNSFALTYFVQNEEGQVYQETNNGILADKPFYRYQLKKVKLSDDDLLLIKDKSEMDRNNHELQFGLDNDDTDEQHLLSLSDLARSIVETKQSREDAKHEADLLHDEAELKESKEIEHKVEVENKELGINNELKIIVARAIDDAAAPKIRKRNIRPSRRLLQNVQNDDEDENAAVAVSTGAQYTILKIHKYDKQTKKYLVEWKEYPKREHWTWEPLAGIEHTLVYQEWSTDNHEPDRD